MTTVRFDKVGEQANERIGIAGWHYFAVECLPHSGPLQVVKITGAVAPLKEPLLNSFARDWTRKDKSTVRDVYITPAEHAVWLRELEAKTGKCSTCDGSSQEFAGWSAANGTRHRTCSTCGGDGLPRLAVADGAGA